MDKEIIINRPQAAIHIVNANKCYNLWGRGTGKSNGGIGPRIGHLASKMPRSQIGIPVPSYIMGFKNILPNIIGFWQNQMGLVENENFVIGRKPPSDWETPIIPILDHKYVLSMDNGTAFPILSMEVEGAANGFNMQALVGDEGKFFKEKKLKEIKRALRGCYKEFGQLPEFQSEWYFSDKYDGDVQWMLNKRNLVDWPLVKAVVAMQLYIDQQRQCIGEDDKAALQLFNSKQLQVDKIRQRLIFVSEASAEENREILGDKFFEDQKADSTPIEYDVAIGNKDPDRAEHSFYPDLSEDHYYNSTNDVDTNKPLIFSMDYQWRIIPMVTAQYGPLKPGAATTLNFVHSCFKLEPCRLDEAIDAWAHHFANHQRKLVYYLFDKTAVGKSPASDPFFEIVMQRLRYNGWQVVPLNMGNTPLHDDKFKLMSKAFKGMPNKPAVRINALTNQNMIRSIRLSEAFSYNGKTSKNKKDEKNPSKPAEDTTHFSDTFDFIIYGCIDLDLVPRTSGSFAGAVLS